MSNKYLRSKWVLSFVFSCGNTGFTLAEWGAVLCGQRCCHSAGGRILNEVSTRMTSSFSRRCSHMNRSPSVSDTCFRCHFRTVLEMQGCVSLLCGVVVHARGWWIPLAGVAARPRARSELGCWGQGASRSASGSGPASVTPRTALSDVEGFGRPRRVHHPGRRGRR